jgi:hypothetical protein
MLLVFVHWHPRSRPSAALFGRRKIRLGHSTEQGQRDSGPEKPTSVPQDDGDGLNLSGRTRTRQTPRLPIHAEYLHYGFVPAANSDKGFIGASGLHEVGATHDAEIG